MGERKYARVTPLASNAKTIKAQGRYDATRSNDLGERQSRESFSGESDGGDRQEFHQWVDDRLESGDQAYSLILNPGEGHARREEVTAWARDTLGRIEAQHRLKLEYRFWIHDDQKAHSHVHAVVFTPQPLRVKTVDQARVRAGEAWTQVLERRQDLRLQLEQRREMSQGRQARSIGRNATDADENSRGERTLRPGTLVVQTPQPGRAGRQDEREVRSVTPEREARANPGIERPQDRPRLERQEERVPNRGRSGLSR
jgi:hypothetical protein